MHLTLILKNALVKCNTINTSTCFKSKCVCFRKNIIHIYYLNRLLWCSLNFTLLKNAEIRREPCMKYIQMILTSKVSNDSRKIQQEMAMYCMLTFKPISGTPNPNHTLL